MPRSSRLSQMETPVSASKVLPSGHSSACGRTTISGMTSAQRVDAATRQRLRHASVHAPAGEVFACPIERLGSLDQRPTIGVLLFDPNQQPLHRIVEPGTLV